jgi:hypothetical protein
VTSGETRPQGRIRRAWFRLGPAWRAALLAFAVSRALLFLVALVDHAPHRELSASYYLFRGGQPHALTAVDVFQRWDSYWFLSVARDGYHAPDLSAAQVEESNIVYFPLYPLAMRALGAIVGDLSIAGLLISIAAFLAGAAALHRLLSLDHPAEQATLGVWLYACLPWSFAFSAIYADGLFFLLSVHALLAARAGRWRAAGLLGGLAALTRLPGLLLALPLALEALARRPQPAKRACPRDLAWILLVPAATAAYFGYLWHLTGHPLAYFTAQRAWANNLVLGTKILRWLRTGNPEPDQLLTLLGTLALLIGGVTLLRRGRLRPAYFWYLVATAAIALPASMLGAARYLMGCVGLFPLLCALCAGRPRAARALFVAAASGTAFTYWLWVTWRRPF